MDAKTQTEYDRIKAGPHAGNFTFLHHEGPLLEYSENVIKRIDYILNEKTDSQHYDRLRHIYFIPAPADKVYQEARAAAYKVYQEARAAADKAYQEATAAAYKVYQEATAPADKVYQEARAPADKKILALIPDCAWNGKTILR